MSRHFVRIAGITALLWACVIYPFLPGDYDAMALPLSTMVQAFGVLGSLLITPVGVFWLAEEIRTHARRKPGHSGTARGHHFAIAAIITSSVLAAALSFIGFAAVGISLGVLSFALWLYIASRLIAKLNGLKSAESKTFNVAPLYLVVIPIAVLLFQVAFAASATEFSRNRVIANAGELINAIEEYHRRHGRYPAALFGVWKDYDPAVVAVDRFHYAPAGAAYNLFFEQPRFVLDVIGTREFVVYNKLDAQAIISHTAWILELAQAQLETNQGWYAVHPTSSPHWKSFWFD